MYLITENLLVGSIDDAQEPSEVIGTLLLVAEEFSITPAAWVDYHRVPFREFAKADPLKLMEAVHWLEPRAPNGRTLVCCRAGLGRSVSVVMARRPGAMPLPNLQVAIEQVRQLRRVA